MAERLRPYRRSQGRGHHGVSRRQWWVMGGLALFVLVDMVLVGIALNVNDPEGTEQPGPIPTFSTPPSATTAPAPPAVVPADPATPTPADATAPGASGG